MLTITLGKEPETYYPGYLPHSQTKMSKEEFDKMLLDNNFKVGDFLTHSQRQSEVDSYGAIKVILSIVSDYDKVKWTPGWAKTPEPYQIQTIGTYSAGLSKDAWGSWDDGKWLRKLTPAEMERWIDDNVQTKLREWGYLT